MSSEIEAMLSKIGQDFQEIPFNRHKKETIARVIHQTPEEISRMTTNFKDNSLDKVVTTENDFLLGTVISFIYYKFLSMHK